MSEQTCQRRTVLKALAGGALLATGTASTAARAEQPPESNAGTASTAQSTRDRQYPRSATTGVYDGTVDRIVDGEHVVVLIESGGKVIDQVVLSRSNYPDLAEGQAVSVFMYRGHVLGVW